MPRWLAVPVALALFTVVVGSAPIQAQEQSPSPLTLRAMNNFAHEHITCSAYYSVGEKCFATDKDPADRNKMRSAALEALVRGGEYTKIAGLKPETVSARLRISFDHMTTQIDNNCSNISILIAEHANACKIILEQPERRAIQIIDTLTVREMKSR